MAGFMPSENSNSRRGMWRWSHRGRSSVTRQQPQYSAVDILPSVSTPYRNPSQLMRVGESISNSRSLTLFFLYIKTYLQI
uniref:Uncharacterized protein n=1 Tax=Physcomitrium patens TaxID=3218 RepID=A0A2K1JG11_PHYPA|nr:hypothetical protein PHYPA_017873 [Physcomitrium patens]